ncbi:hypothetical protein P170DRAFT_354009 [Aspergillus steynii IBT 23096]|uniref:Pal1-domain-containing protein n=1 Tax=Aspergillus steynii IBT 23096 TaxID=1392250 RepID=A0A2I2GCY0_9EURO|nr:uncharacterized protein P170DRAFT_354009 [Aspergillus steynii IBT 23096]PLB50697.1 hypothetical protein P170DRAFT_354009 [Aspergillus steynii IBT 23096]
MTSALSPLPHYSSSPRLDMTRHSQNPYYRFLSPSPSRHTLRRQRSSSVPSVYYNGMLEHFPMEQPRRRDYPTYHHHNHHNHHSHHHEPRRHSTMRSGRRQSRYPRDSLLVNPDIIDRLDDAGIYQYHHEGPYDAVYPERNHDTKASPVEALQTSNAEALKATPSDKIRDCLDGHRPLDGVAYFPPGHTDREGQTYEYEEGTNMMNDYGNFMRCPGLKFTDEDFKNDPFYNKPLPKPFASLRKVLNFRRRRGTT